MIRAAIVPLACVLVFLWSGVVKTFAAQQKKEAQTSSQSDPIQKILSTGVDKIGPQGGQSYPTLQRRNPRYRVEDGDVIDLKFPFTPAFDQSVTVQPDGYITLQQVGDIHVAGETIPDIRANLQKAYANVLRDPVISITLKQFENPYFMALGQVTHPGKYDLRGDTTVAEGVTMAGGFTNAAKDSQVLLFRRVSDNWASVEKLDIKHMLRSGNLSEDLHLQPGDMIYVPQNAISKIKPYIPLPNLSMMMYHTP